MMMDHFDIIKQHPCGGLESWLQLYMVVHYSQGTEKVVSPVRARSVKPNIFFNQLATGWVTRKMASSQRQQMASVSAVEEWVGGQHPNYTPSEIHT